MRHWNLCFCCPFNIQWNFTEHCSKDLDTFGKLTKGSVSLAWIKLGWGVRTQNQVMRQCDVICKSSGIEIGWPGWMCRTCENSSAIPNSQKSLGKRNTVHKWTSWHRFGYEKKCNFILHYKLVKWGDTLIALCSSWQPESLERKVLPNYNNNLTWNS